METIAGSGDPYFNLYANAFSPTDQLANQVALNDDGAGSLRPRITLALTPGTAYHLVTTQFAPTTTDMPYTNRISCPTAQVTIVGATTCASEGYTGTQLTWCRNICEMGYTGATLSVWIRRWTERYRQLPYCALPSGT